MKQMEIIKGKKFGRWTIVSSKPKYKGQKMWLCKCDCGKEAIVRGTSLTSGASRSCGCLQKDATRIANTKHGHYDTRLHRIWSGIKTRCNNPNSTSYRNYGRRGIRICDEWLHDYVTFERWALSHGYDDALTIDRINNDGNYEPVNCRWITRQEQNKNKRKWNCNRTY